MVSVYQDAVVALDLDGATAIDSALLDAVSLDVKATAYSDGVSALDSDLAAVSGLDQMEVIDLDGVSGIDCLG